MDKSKLLQSKYRDAGYSLREEGRFVAVLRHGERVGLLAQHLVSRDLVSEFPDIFSKEGGKKGD